MTSQSGVNPEGQVPSVRTRRLPSRLPIVVGLVLLATLVALLPGAGAGPRAESMDLLKALLPSAPPGRQVEALHRVLESRDRRFIAPLIDLVRFARSAEVYGAYLEALRELTGEKIEGFGEPWTALMTWYGNHPELEPPPGYTGWKGELHALIDPRFREFLYEGAPASVRVEEVVWGGVKVDGIPALVNPRAIAADEANYLNAAEPVFGVSLGGDDRAYPLRILDWHEMANDVVAGKPVALAYCTLCGAGILYETTVAGTRYEFGSSGFLFRSNKLMYDRTTGTLWNQLTGEPVIGRLVGQKIRLRVLPVVVTSWGEWKRQHPDTKVLDRETGYDRPYEIGGPYGRYFGSPGTMFPVWRRSRLLADKARIFAIEVEGRPKAYPLETLGRQGGVVNDTVASVPLVVITRDVVSRIPLPEKWRAALAAAGDTKTQNSYANDLTLGAARAALTRDPSLAHDATPELLLAMPAETRLPLLAERSSEERAGTSAPPGAFTPDFRNQVAQRGLIGETRAYERGGHRFAPGKRQGDEVVDEDGRGWRVTEDALLGAKGEHLKRLPGHLAYWFGWFAFYPRTEVYTSPDAQAYRPANSVPVLPAPGGTVTPSPRSGTGM